nr:glycosyltransferase [uncultured Acetatifactor sp.]
MENITDLVSIIIPVFNIEKYVSECIESIAAQTSKNIQIILVDDGSTDKSGEICDKYAALDGRIEVIHQHNKGLVVARKQGLKSAKGQ